MMNHDYRYLQQQQRHHPHSQSITDQHHHHHAAIRFHQHHLDEKKQIEQEEEAVAAMISPPSHHQQQLQQQQQLSTTPPLVIVKPLAMKIARPQAVRPSQPRSRRDETNHHHPPKDHRSSKNHHHQQHQPRRRRKEEEEEEEEDEEDRHRRRHNEDNYQRDDGDDRRRRRQRNSIGADNNNSNNNNNHSYHAASIPPSPPPPAPSGLVRPTPVRLVRPQTIRPKLPLVSVAPVEGSEDHHSQHEPSASNQHHVHIAPAAAVARTQRLFRQVQPFSRQASEQFYEVAHAQQIAGTDLHQAVMESQDWHRKWTFQDEEGHTRPQYYNVATTATAAASSPNAAVLAAPVATRCEREEQDHIRNHRDSSSEFYQQQPPFHHHHHQQQQQPNPFAVEAHRVAVPSHYQYHQQHHPMFLELMHREMDGAKNPSPQMSPGTSPPSSQEELTPPSHQQQQQGQLPTPALFRPKPLHAKAAAAMQHVNTIHAMPQQQRVMSSSYGNKSYHPPLYEDEEQILVVAPTLLDNSWSRNSRKSKPKHHYHHHNRRRVHDMDSESDSEDDDDDFLHDSKRRATHMAKQRHHRRRGRHDSNNDDDDGDDFLDRRHRHYLASRPSVIPDDKDDEEADRLHHDRNDPQLLFPVRPKVLRPVAMRVALPPPAFVRDDDDEYDRDRLAQEEPFHRCHPLYRHHSSQDAWSTASTTATVPKHVIFDRSSPSSPLSIPTVHSGFDDAHMTGGAAQELPEQINIIEEEEEVVEEEVVDDCKVEEPRVVMDYLQHLAMQQQQPQKSTMVSRSSSQLSPTLQAARDEVLRVLALTGGEVQDAKFLAALEPLVQHYTESQHDTRPLICETASSSSSSPDLRVEGMWLSLSKPTFFGNLGENDHGDPMYTLGRMAFDMYTPAQLVCSLQGNFNPVSVVPPLSDNDDASQRAIRDGLPVPKKFQEEVASGTSVLRTYNVVSAITVEPNLAAFPNAPNKDVRRPIKGIMTTYGYSLPDPEVPNRHSVWFTGGRIEPNNDPTDVHEWKRLFQRPEHQKRGWGEQAKLLAAKMLMGATVPTAMADDGSMEYTFTRPLGGHGVAYIDVIYLDDTLRIVRGHRGTVFVFARLPEQETPF